MLLEECYMFFDLFDVDGLLGVGSVMFLFV